VPELRDAMGEAGLARTGVFGTMPDAVDGEGRAYVEPVAGGDVGESFIVLVAGRKRGEIMDAGGTPACQAPPGWWAGP
jgi:hypothetical protein